MGFYISKSKRESGHEGRGQSELEDGSELAAGRPLVGDLDAGFLGGRG